MNMNMIVRDARMLQIMEIIRTAAPSDAAVLIEGESGTGKRLIAAAFHDHSRRAAGPFIHVNCAAITPDQVEAVLEAANGGTLLLNEVAGMPSHLQMKFSCLAQINFRIIVTTNGDSTAMLRDGVLQKDLYFRISTIKIRVPALRERLDDIPLLARHFLERFNTQHHKKIRRLSRKTLFRLLHYDWPGNVRELESVIERAVLFCTGNELTPECLTEELQGKELRSMPFVVPPLVPMEEIEREAIVQTLARTSGNVKRSAQILRYPRPTFYRKLKKFGIKVERAGPRPRLDCVDRSRVSGA
jgi:DNA-binding NtrC family response regulator